MVRWARGRGGDFLKKKAVCGGNRRRPELFFILSAADHVSKLKGNLKALF